MKEEWLFSGALVPVDVETTAALVAEIKRLIDVVGGMALAQQEGMEAGRLVEREACAKLCEKQIEKENLLKTGDNQTLSNLLIGHRVTAHMTDARLIRARGDA